MGAEDSFEADPGRLSSAIGEIEAIVAMVMAAVDTFTSSLGAYNGWEGTDDEYARTVGPKFDKSVKGVTETGQTIADAIASIVNGRLAELKEIASAQGSAMDSIDAARSAIENLISNGGGSGTGGSRR